MPQAFGTWDSGAYVGFGMIVGVIALLVGIRACSASECDTICKANGDKTAWTFTQGCYCRDESGMYNPQDSRDR